jgi:hypothetical protein
MATRVLSDSPDDLITVCDACKCASCWQGLFLCWESTGAGTVKMRRDALVALDYEHPVYMRTDEELKS